MQVAKRSAGPPEVTEKRTHGIRTQATLSIDESTFFALRSDMPAVPRIRKKSGDEPSLQFRLRVMHQGAIALGPGKIDLLTAIDAHGSISKGARSLGMSYMRAWTLVKVMNHAFRSPLVEVERGGAKGGVARLTPRGLEVLALYGDLVQLCQSVSAKRWGRLQKHLGPAQD